MHKDLLLVYLHELLFHPGEYVPRTRIIGKCEHTVVHVERWLITVTNLESFLVPFDHF